MFLSLNRNILCRSVNIQQPQSWNSLGILSCCHHIKYFSLSSTVTSQQNSFYDDLGIHPQSTAREIKEAFYKLSKEYHPDKNVDNAEALKKFQSISEAYELLSNPAKRIKYDKGVLGRNSSVAESEAASHRFEGEQFYGSRGSLKIHRQIDSNRNLDAWVNEQKSESFQAHQIQKQRTRVVGTRDARFHGMVGKSAFDKQKYAQNAGANRQTDSKLFFSVGTIVLIFMIMRVMFV